MSPGRCLLCDAPLPRPHWWQRLLRLQAPTCRSAGLPEQPCIDRFLLRLLALKEQS